MPPSVQSRSEHSDVEDVVAIAVRLNDGTERFFITWGRLQDAVDPRPLASLVLRHAHRFALGGTPVGARACWSLWEARDAPYLYEHLTAVARERIPYGRGYANWKAKKISALEAGKEIYYCGAEHGPTDPPLDAIAPGT
jgi:hypothetical protein